MSFLSNIFSLGKPATEDESQSTADSEALPPGTVLNDGNFTIERLLGQGAFGCTYLAYDPQLHRRVAIKEYMPGLFARRTTNFSIRAKPGENAQEVFTWGLGRFLEEARTLARFKNPGIVQVITFFEEFGTAYLVMQNEEGQDLEQLLDATTRFSEAQIVNLIRPILEGLSQIHKADVIHRDIKPSNIIVHPDGSGVLVDFGSARGGQFRTATNLNKTNTNFTSLVTLGYSPIEQWSTDARVQGPWTDIYALGATLYHMVTGVHPFAAPDRIVDPDNDPLIPAVKLAGEGFSLPFLEAIDWALKPRHKDRPGTIEEWRATLFSAARERTARQPTLISPELTPQPSDLATIEPKEPRPDVVRESAPQPSTDSSGSRKRVLIKLAASLVVVCIIGGAAYLLFDGPISPTVSDQELLAQATVNIDAGHWLEAIKDLRTIADDSPFASQAQKLEQKALDRLTGEIDAALQQNALDRATKLHEQVSQEFPADPRLQSLGTSIREATAKRAADRQQIERAEQQMAAGDWQEALHIFRGISSQSEQASTAKDGERRIRADLTRRIEGALAAGRIEDGDRLYKQAVEVFPSDEAIAALGVAVSASSAAQATLQARLQTANEHLAADRWQDALQLFREVPDGNPLVGVARAGEQRVLEHVTSHLEALQAARQLEDAAKLHEQGSKFFPGEKRLQALGSSISTELAKKAEDGRHLTTGEAHLAAGRWQAALEQFRAVPADSSAVSSAREGIQNVLQHVTNRMEVLLAAQRLDDSAKLQAQALAAFPEASRLKTLGKAIDAALANKRENERRVASGEAHLAAGRWQAALEQFRAVPADSSAVEVATDGVKKVFLHVTSRIEELLAAQRVEDSARLQAQALAAFPEASRLKTLGKAIDAALASKRENERRIASGEAHLAAGRWQAALEQFRAVPDNSPLAIGAQRGEKNVLDYVVNRLEELREANALAEAAQLHARGSKTFPGEQQLATLGTLVDVELASKKADEKFLSRAEELFATGRWQAALEHYRVISSDSKRFAQATAGVDGVRSYVIDRAKKDIATGSFKTAGDLLARADIAFPGDDEFALLQQTLHAARPVEPSWQQKLERIEQDLASPRWREALAEYTAMLRNNDGTREQIAISKERLANAVFDIASSRLSDTQTMLRKRQPNKARSALRELMRMQEEGARLFPGKRDLRVSLPLKLAALAYQVKWLTSPQKNSAKRLLDHVLAFEPANPQAQKQKMQIVTWYTEQARTQMLKSNFAGTLKYLQSAESVLPGTQLVAKAQADLREARQRLADVERRKAEAAENSRARARARATQPQPKTSDQGAVQAGRRTAPAHPGEVTDKESPARKPTPKPAVLAEPKPKRPAPIIPVAPPPPAKAKQPAPEIPPPPPP